VIVNGELVDGVGGGTCQVASTLHAAAFLAGFEIVEHRPHSRPAGYVPLGLDATVVWPEVDLVVRNPYPFPVRVRARAEGRELRVDLLGSAAPPSVTWSRQILSTEPPGERVVEDAAVGWGAAEVSQDGIPGYTVLRRRTIDRGAGPIVEERVLRYPPTDRIVRIPPKQPAS
ncbi:MAG TPA: VanW family protein, partial [Polyangiaceae bacterium LLY-WYZ-15_(1-7)]|nr:VanW family protein [Polyangiaceae bacterium LLY-WYZ-15_(1-7)]